MKKKIAILVLLSLVLLIVSYLLGNRNKPSSGETAENKLSEWLRKDVLKWPSTLEQETDFIQINTSYDKQLIPKYDNDGFEEGTIAVTDRTKLTEFLLAARRIGTYRYIIVDLDLSQTDNMIEDSALTAANRKLCETLLSMERVIVAKGLDSDGEPMPLMDNRLDDMAGLVFYVRTLFESDMVSIPMIYHNWKSAALIMAEQTDGHHLWHWGPFYFDNKRPCRKKVFPDNYTYISNNQRVPYENLGADILSDTSLLSSRIENKIVIIGDFENDIHDTFIGSRPGSTIILDTYYSILHNRHIVCLGWVIFLFLFYSVLGYFMFYHPIFDTSKWCKGLRFISSFVSYTLIFIIIKITVYYWLHIDYNIVIPTLWFGIVANIFKIWVRKQ